VPCCVDMQALPPDNQPLKPVNASRLSVWICEGPKGNGIDSKLGGLLQPSHTIILWAAAVCRICTDNIFWRRKSREWAGTGDASSCACAGYDSSVPKLTRLSCRIVVSYVTASVTMKTARSDSELQYQSVRMPPTCRWLPAASFTTCAGGSCCG
jgi:hypothetical protein